MYVQNLGDSVCLRSNVSYKGVSEELFTSAVCAGEIQGTQALTYKSLS